MSDRRHVVVQHARKGFVPTGNTFGVVGCTLCREHVLLVTTRSVLSGNTAVGRVQAPTTVTVVTVILLEDQNVSKYLCLSH